MSQHPGKKVSSYHTPFFLIMVGISFVRELGPAITSLVCACRIASGIGAELGSMRVTEQINAMEVSGTNPFKYQEAPRIRAPT